MEKTFVILKPDAVTRKLVGEIISRFEKRDMNLIHIKTSIIGKSEAEAHYAHVSDLPIYNDMIEYITSGPVVMMVLEGERVIQMVRNMMGKTSTLESVPGTIRGDYGYHRFQNLIHASDSQESAEIELKRFFPEFYS